MPLNLDGIDRLSVHAVTNFWASRDTAKSKQMESGTVDVGARGSVTSGKNMDGFIQLMTRITQQNGLPDAQIHTESAVLTLPGFFRPTKLWDVLIMHDGVLIAALEFKSQCGPSFGNNFNNRCEETLGSSLDFWTAYREGALGAQSAPFLGWLMLVEDCEDSRKPVSTKSPHFQVREEFRDASYLQRYDIFAQKLLREKLYTATALLCSKKGSNSFADMSEMTSLKSLSTNLAGHIAARVANSKK